MPYITSVERRGIEKGKEEGIREGILESLPTTLEIKFGAEGLEILPEISQIQDLDVLRAVVAGIKTKKTVQELRQIYL